MVTFSKPLERPERSKPHIETLEAKSPFLPPTCDPCEAFKPSTPSKVAYNLTLSNNRSIPLQRLESWSKTLARSPQKKPVKR